jgi:hypothetical protein
MDPRCPSSPFLEGVVLGRVLASNAKDAKESKADLIAVVLQDGDPFLIPPLDTNPRTQAN